MKVSTFLLFKLSRYLRLCLLRSGHACSKSNGRALYNRTLRECCIADYFKPKSYIWVKECSKCPFIPFSHEIGLDRQQIYASRDMRACVIQPKSNHTPLHRNARALAISLPAFHPATPPRLASIGQVRRS